METKDILIIILPFISGFITYFFAIKTKKSEAIIRFKEEKYANLLVLLQGFVGKTANSERKKAFLEEQYKSWLYCSDDVVMAINKMVQLVAISKGKDPNPEEGRKAVGNIVLAMRKDLLGKTKLEYNDFRYTDIIDN